VLKYLLANRAAHQNPATVLKYLLANRAAHQNPAKKKPNASPSPDQHA
jgi:hypothetical protein